MRLPKVKGGWLVTFRHPETGKSQSLTVTPFILAVRLQEAFDHPSPELINEVLKELP